MGQENLKSPLVSSEYSLLIEKVSTIVHQISGNKLGDKQAFMVETRVRKRMLELNFKQPSEYLSYLEKNLNKESTVLVGLITTHHTFFFREFVHFELLKKILPELVVSAKKRENKTIQVWSAACSRGQEVYSLAMFFDYYLPQIDPSLTYKILGTDIDEESVRIAENGVYHQNEIKEIPMNFLKDHWARGTGEISMYAKVKKSLRDKVNFKSANLLNIKSIVESQKFDVIFCRNVFIYFEQNQIEEICKNIYKGLAPGGVFFSGISESLTGMKTDFNSIGPSAYRSKDFKAPGDEVSTGPASSIPRKIEKVDSLPMINALPEVIRVLCVDDSPSILTLLKKVLSKEHGFDVVATAANGKEAMDKMQGVRVDAMTLDIHMPEMDGVTYLSKNFNGKHPPVIMVSSASREDKDTGIKAIEFGASDFVEKPSLQNMDQVGDEIRNKIKSAIIDKTIFGKPKISSVDHEFQKVVELKDVSQMARVAYCSMSDLPRLKSIFDQFQKNEPPLIIFFEGMDELFFKKIQEKFPLVRGKVSLVSNSQTTFHATNVYMANIAQHHQLILQCLQQKKISVFSFGMMSKNCQDKMMEWKNAQLLIEDLGKELNAKNPLLEIASDVVPATSFYYMSNIFLTK